ncbi:hypothetical protein GXP67_08450 [Rhodocytophaga rosea]|uniref:Uncharacterized protein n=1 Tax=Rhodocytophaga rosea TaxID=2704465 RepID=A0A6C0GFH6_9BACT|nr:hypothetical protein [Rhodocytophaga rosea]QHT66687.1 hypothetical protein GXP67_08450 [Rhodocytophaga rosea]
MLSPLQLRQLPLQQQAQYVCEYGKFVDSKFEGETTVNMYWLDKYYAEVIYNSLSNQVQDIELKEAFHDH